MRAEVNEQKRIMLEHYVRQMADEVVKTGEERSLGVLEDRDRGIVHRLVEGMENVTEISVGTGHAKTMLLRPASRADAPSRD
jgi:predicted RNA-binding protein Jag